MQSWLNEQPALKGRVIPVGAFSPSEAETVFVGDLVSPPREQVIAATALGYSSTGWSGSRDRARTFCPVAGHLLQRLLELDFPAGSIMTRPEFQLASTHYPEHGHVRSSLRHIPEGCLVLVPTSIMVWQSHIRKQGAWVHAVLAQDIMAPTPEAGDVELASVGLPEKASMSLSAFEFTEKQISEPDQPILPVQTKQAKGLRWLDYKDFEKLYCMEKGEAKFDTAKRAVRRRLVVEHAFLPSTEQGWVPQQQDVDLPIFSGDILKRLFNKAHESSGAKQFDHNDHLPENVKRRRIANADLRRKREERRTESASTRHRWRPIDDFGPVAPWRRGWVQKARSTSPLFPHLRRLIVSSSTRSPHSSRMWNS